jgi:transposase InsO family protein
MCQLFGISRSAYYAWVRRLEQLDPDTERMRWVQEAYEKSQRTYGYRRITMWLSKHRGIHMNHKAVLRLMNKLNIHSVARKRKVFRSVPKTQIYHHYANLLNQQFHAQRPNQKWVTDVTYIAIQNGWAYLSTIQDLFDGFIVSYKLARTNSLVLVLQTLQQARQNEPESDGLILHSDHGYQYTSHSYAVLLQHFAITPSMSRIGNCWDNAPMENFFGHLKEEALRQHPTPSFAEAQRIIDQYVHFFNYERIQLKTRQTPYETRCLSS